jgi:carotenoid cleavage dioxygenase
MPQADPTAVLNNLAPIPMECDAPFLTVDGELPRELNGTLYRNGPNPQFDVPSAHWFAGDGMLHRRIISAISPGLSANLRRSAFVSSTPR